MPNGSGSTTTGGNGNGNGNDNNTGSDSNGKNDSDTGYKPGDHVTVQGCSIIHDFAGGVSRQQVATFYIKEGNIIKTSQCLNPEEFDETRNNSLYIFKHQIDLDTCPLSFSSAVSNDAGIDHNISHHFYKQQKKYIDPPSGRLDITPCQTVIPLQLADHLVLWEKDYSSCTPIIDYQNKKYTKRYKKIAVNGSQSYTVSNCIENEQPNELLISNTNCLVRPDYQKNIAYEQEKYLFREDDGTLKNVSDCFDTSDIDKQYRISYSEQTCQREVDLGTNTVILQVRPYYTYSNNGTVVFLGQCQPAASSSVLEEVPALVVAGSENISYTMMGIIEGALEARKANEKGFSHNIKNGTSARLSTWVFKDYAQVNTIFKAKNVSSTSKYNYSWQAKTCEYKNGYENYDEQLQSAVLVRRYFVADEIEIWPESQCTETMVRVPYISKGSTETARNDDSNFKTWYTQIKTYQRPDGSTYSLTHSNYRAIAYSPSPDSVSWVNDDANLKNIKTVTPVYIRADGTKYQAPATVSNMNYIAKGARDVRTSNCPMGQVGSGYWDTYQDYIRPKDNSIYSKYIGSGGDCQYDNGGGGKN